MEDVRHTSSYFLEAIGRQLTHVCIPGQVSLPAQVCRCKHECRQGTMSRCMHCPLKPSAFHHAHEPLTLSHCSILGFELINTSSETGHMALWIFWGKLSFSIGM